MLGLILAVSFATFIAVVVGFVLVCVGIDEVLEK